MDKISEMADMVVRVLKENHKGMSLPNIEQEACRQCRENGISLFKASTVVRAVASRHGLQDELVRFGLERG